MLFSLLGTAKKKVTVLFVFAFLTTEMSSRNDVVQMMSPSARLRRAREIFAQNKEHARNLSVGIGTEEKVNENSLKTNVNIDYGSSSSSSIIKPRYGHNSNMVSFESLNSNTNSLNELNIINENDKKTPLKLPIKITGLVNQLDQAWISSNSLYSSSSNHDDYYNQSSSSSSSSNINMTEDDRYSVIVMLQNEVDTLQKQLKEMEDTVLQSQNERQEALASVEDSKRDLMENNRKLVIENNELKKELIDAKNKIISENAALRSDLHESQGKLDKATRILSRLRFRQNQGITLHQ